MSLVRYYHNHDYWTICRVYIPRCCSCDLLPEIKRRIALGWAEFTNVANIMKS